MTAPNDPEAREAAKRVLMDPEHRRMRAFHECGHTVWLFLDGRETDIRYIDIAPRDFGPGIYDFDTGVFAYGGLAYSAKWVSAGVNPRERLIRAARSVAFSFAGPVCECLSAGWNNPKEIWEDALRYEWESQLGDATTFSDDPRLEQLDFGVALQSVYAICPSSDQRVDSIPPSQTRYLAKSVRWSIETFSHPDVWRVTQALVSEFEPVNQDRVEGARVRQIIRGAWGDSLNEGIPLHRLGPRWGRHYGCLLQN
jgi:hypothetical protein